MMIKSFKGLFCAVLIGSIAFSATDKGDEENVDFYRSYYSLDNDLQTRNGQIGQFGFPSNPMNDRAKGYLLNGVVKNAITNYGNFINWDEQPSGLWGDYAYLPAVAFLAGLPGHSRSSEYQWQSVEYVDEDGDGLTDYTIWSSTAAYDAWFEDNGDTIFVCILSIPNERCSFC